MSGHMPFRALIGFEIILNLFVTYKQNSFRGISKILSNPGEKLWSLLLEPRPLTFGVGNGFGSVCDYWVRFCVESSPARPSCSPEIFFFKSLTFPGGERKLSRTWTWNRKKRNRNRGGVVTTMSEPFSRRLSSVPPYQSQLVTFI